MGRAERRRAVLLTDPARASAFGQLHYVDVTAEELAKFERPHSKRILEAEPIAVNDWRTADPAIIARVKSLEIDSVRELHIGTPAEIARAFDAAGNRITEPTAGNFDRDAANADWQGRVDAAGIAHGGNTQIPAMRDPPNRESQLSKTHIRRQTPQRSASRPSHAPASDTRGSGDRLTAAGNRCARGFCAALPERPKPSPHSFLGSRPNLRPKRSTPKPSGDSKHGGRQHRGSGFALG